MLIAAPFNVMVAEIGNMIHIVFPETFRELGGDNLDIFK